jgi:hypothetical protein
MKYLLDVSLLLAWGWADHAEHRRAASWIAAMKAKRVVIFLTSAIPELGFIRISVQRAGGSLPVAAAAETLAGMLGSLGRQHQFLADDLSSAMDWPQCGAGRHRERRMHTCWPWRAGMARSSRRSTPAFPEPICHPSDDGRIG